MPGILEGLQIVEGSAFIAAPFLGMSLAELGADVIRFDPIEGAPDIERWPVTSDGRSLYWAGLNKGKRSIRIDIRHPEGKELANALITRQGADAGFFITNFPAKGWLSYEALIARRHDLIMVNIMGNRDGSTAVDYTVNSATGFPFMTGTGGLAAPTNHVMPAWDLITGLTAAVGMLAAERKRKQTGEGQFIRLALSDVAFAVMGDLGYIADVQINGAERRTSGNYLFGAFGRDFVTKDGRRVMIVAISRRQWKSMKLATGLGGQFDALAARLGLDFEREGDRFQAREEIGRLLEAWFLTKTSKEVEELFRRESVCWGPYQTIAEMVEGDPRVSEASPMFRQVENPGIGRYLTPGSPLEFGDALRVPPARAPRLGEHTDEILSSVLGLSSSEIGRFHDERIVAGPQTNA
jgi:2-methylfumaryl-CoA isomerase